MSDFTLTQFLYQKKDVELMIVFGLLKHTEYNELLFWTSEYMYSGYGNHIIELLWQIYFDFYILQYPDFYKYISRKQKLFKKTGKHTYILDILKNLYYMKHTPYFFEFRLCFQQNTHTKTSLKGRKPKWTDDYSPEYKEILLNIDKQNASNCVVLYNTCKDYASLYKELVTYASSKERKLTETTSKLLFTLTNLVEKYDGLETNSHRLVLLYIYKLSICEPQLEIFQNQKMIKTSDKDLSIYNEYHKVQKKDTYNWKFIQDACVYGVSKFVHLFNPSRKSITYWKKIWYSWEYYAYTCPLWNTRFNECNARPDHKNKRIQFKNDDDLEQFYEQFGLEPDEQTKETQEKFICEFQNISIIDFFTHIWDYNTGVLSDSTDYIY